MMVDNDWNVTGVFDLEWMIAAPIDMLRIPGWLTWDSIDHVAGDGYEEYNEIREAFMKILKEEEAWMDTWGAAYGSKLSTVMNESWHTKRYWFYTSLLSVGGMDLLTRHGLPSEALFKMWCPGAIGVVERKLADRAVYLKEIAKLFKVSEKNGLSS
ncbi:hypothetical protein SPI_08456 [Niveomyces insectorum RCEF 264]|uniref:Aminoglycoside phosphotransferase n=1 Tax=Niveomyces insectorum RCEF 264 TaxID=1081102 RepID=A0A167MZN1_9HYPO|nr:hypothetical protein SPI_08456 [Niveomyces insectorum RCEF 264]